MALSDKVKNLIPFLRGPLRLPPDLLRGLHPTRNPFATWQREGEDNNVVIMVPRPVVQGWRMALAKIAGEPPGKRVELSDEIGSDVWELCDGAHTVREICRELSAKYKLGDRQTEVSVLEYLNMLRKRRLLGIPEKEQSSIQQAAGKAKSAPADTATTGQASDGNRLGTTKRTRAKRARRH